MISPRQKPPSVASGWIDHGPISKHKRFVRRVVRADAPDGGQFVMKLKPHSEKAARRFFTEVGRVTPNMASDSFHYEQPAWVRYRIAARTCRSSTRRRPPPCGRLGAGGISGAAISHNESGAHFPMAFMSTEEDLCPGST
jgi:hypothetical protein